VLRQWRNLAFKTYSKYYLSAFYIRKSANRNEYELQSVFSVVLNNVTNYLRSIGSQATIADHFADHIDPI